jgi:hypothetical protein
MTKAGSHDAGIIPPLCEHHVLDPLSGAELCPKHTAIITMFGRSLLMGLAAPGILCRSSTGPGLRPHHYLSVDGIHCFHSNYGAPRSRIVTSTTTRPTAHSTTAVCYWKLRHNAVAPSSRALSPLR